jgi:NDP-sugar pyrophosphorylase family protein
MLTIMIATGASFKTRGINERYPTPIFPLVDKPFIEHLIDFVIEQNVGSVEFVLSHLPEQIEKLLGDGSRWGTQFRFHLAKDPMRPYDVLKSARAKYGPSPILLAHADRFPQIDLEAWVSRYHNDELVMFSCQETGAYTEAQATDSAWTGWGLIPPSFLDDLPLGLNEQDIQERLNSAVKRGGQTVAVSRVLDFRTYKGILDANKLVLSGQFENIVLGGKEIQNGIRISRNVSIHSSANLTPPVFIGENSLIGKQTRLGPFAVIGRNCILDPHSSVREAIVAPDSHVGEALEVKEALIDRNRIINVKSGSEICLSDNFILGGLAGKNARLKVEGLMSRSIGVALLLVLSPLMLIVMFFLKVFRKGPAFFTTEVVSLPAPSDCSLWVTFPLLSFLPRPEKIQERQSNKRGAMEGAVELLLNFFPALINIARGDLRFVGLPPRTPEEIVALEEDWKALYLNGKLGVISEAFVRYGSHPSEEELYSAEAFYSIMGDPWYDFKLMTQYLSKTLFGWLSARKR